MQKDCDLLVSSLNTFDQRQFCDHHWIAISIGDVHSLFLSRHTGGMFGATHESGWL